jgi:hypothetical protein
VLSGRAQQPYYKRRVPPDARAVLGQSSFTILLEGDPAGSPRQRAALLSSWSVANEQAEKTLANARLSQRQLTPQEQLGVAGAWEPTAPTAAHSPDTPDREELVAMLQAMESLGVVLPSPLAADWRPEPPAAQGKLIEQAAKRTRSGPLRVSIRPCSGLQA